MNKLPVELADAITKATDIYNQNSIKIKEFAKKLDEESGYNSAKAEVSRLYADYLATNE